MPLRLPNTRVVFLTLAFVLPTACHAKRSADARQPSPLTPVAQEIQRRGYHAKESLVVPPTTWETSTLRMRSKRFFSFRADQPQPGSRDYFCRFSLFEETYDTVDDARHRFEAHAREGGDVAHRRRATDRGRPSDNVIIEFSGAPHVCALWRTKES